MGSEMDEYKHLKKLSWVLLVLGIAVIVVLEVAGAKIGSADPSSIIGVVIFLGPSAILGTIARKKKKALMRKVEPEQS